MSLDPPFCKLFPHSLLLVSIDDDMSLSVTCKCALLVGWWRRMGWPMAFLRHARPAGVHGSRQGRLGGAEAVYPVFDLASGSPWTHRCFRDLLARLETASLTLAGHDSGDVFLMTAKRGSEMGIPTMIVGDAVEAGASDDNPPDRSTETLLRKLRHCALLMPLSAFALTIESEA
jgi:hypothetical protein